MVGSTNSLLLQQKEKYSDILVNLDENNSITITSPSLRTALQLSAADRRWIDFLTQTVLDTWDPDNPSRPKNHGYAGSEDAIRMHFEEYVLSLLSSMAYQLYHESLAVENIPVATGNIPDNFPDPGDTAADFSPDFLAMWRTTNNFTLFNKLTQGNRIFDIIEPRHPTAGGLSVEDVQRRLAQGMADLHIDERVRDTREVVGRTLQSGRERVEAGLGKFWAEVERARQQRRERGDKRRSRSRSVVGSGVRGSSEVERRGNGDPTTKTGTLSNTSSDSSWVAVEDARDSPEKRATSPPGPDSNTTIHASSSSSSPSGPNPVIWSAALRDRAAKVDTAQIQASAREGAAKASAYLSSWGSWARERMAQQQVVKGGVIPSNPETQRTRAASGRGSGAGGG